MKSENSMSLCIDALSQNESFIRSTVAAFCVQLNPTIEQIGDIKTAVSEAITNAVVHAYSNEGGKVEVDVLLKNSVVKIIISDKGKGISDVQKAMQPFYTSSPVEERSGMGFTVMQAMMDKVTVDSKVDKGTVVTLKKDLNKKDA